MLKQQFLNLRESPGELVKTESCAPLSKILTQQIWGGRIYISNWRLGDPFIQIFILFYFY